MQITNKKRNYMGLFLLLIVYLYELKLILHQILRLTYHIYTFKYIH